MTKLWKTSINQTKKSYNSYKEVTILKVIKDICCIYSYYG